MKIDAARIGMKARTSNGRESEIVGIFHDGTIAVDFGPGDYHWIKFNASCLEPVSDPCESCQKLSSIDKCCEYWKAAYEEARRNAAYWREELEKLQKEALAECRPLSEVAKCYIRVAPEKPLMSQEARRVVEYLTARNKHDWYLNDILECMDFMPGSDVMDGLIEARDAGRIRLVNGKYEIVRD